MGSRWLIPRPGRFIPGKELVTHCIRGWVGPGARSGSVRKTLPSLGFDPRNLPALYRIAISTELSQPKLSQSKYKIFTA